MQGKVDILIRHPFRAGVIIVFVRVLCVCIPIRCAVGIAVVAIVVDIAIDVMMLVVMKDDRLVLCSIHSRSYPIRLVQTSASLIGRAGSRSMSTLLLLLWFVAAPIALGIGLGSIDGQGLTRSGGRIVDVLLGRAILLRWLLLMLLLLLLAIILLLLLLMWRILLLLRLWSISSVVRVLQLVLVDIHRRIRLMLLLLLLLLLLWIVLLARHHHDE